MAHFAVKHFSPLRKSFSPSLRHWRHFASRFLAMRLLIFSTLLTGGASERGSRYAARG
jgi:hypothetical protein